MPRYLPLLILWCVSSACQSHAADLPPDVQRKADQVFLGFDDTLMRINSGICRITGKTTKPSGKVIKDVINDDILIAFDYNAHFYRFDNGDLKRTLLTPEFFYEVWHPNTSQVSVKRSSASAPEATSIFCHLVDIQDVFRFVPVGPHKPYAYQQSAFHENNRGIIKSHYEDLPNGIVRVTTKTPPSVIIPEFTEYLINTNNGYTVQHIKRSVGYVFDISWKSINQTWVPVAYVFKSGEQFGNFGVEWKIEWEQVNGKVDPKFFSLDEMLADQEDGAIMLSEELGSPPLIIGKVGKGATPLSYMSLPNKYHRLRFWLVAVGTVLIIFALGKMWYDRKKKS